MRVAKIEFVRGFVSTILLTTVLGLWGILLSFFTGILWEAGGSYWKSWRRIGVPWVTALAIFPIWQNGLVVQWLITYWVGYGILCLGDGYPDFHNIPNTDQGSWLGRQVKKLGLSDEIGGELTKWLIVVLLQLAWIPIFWR